MEIRRSLSPGKVFFEKDGVVTKVPAQKLGESSKKSGSRRVNGMLVQWGVSDTLVRVDNVRFHETFGSVPNVSVNTSPPMEVEIRNITVDGFQIVTRSPSVTWSAFGPAPR